MLTTHHRFLRARYMLRYLPYALSYWVSSYWRVPSPPPSGWNALLPNTFILGGKRCGTRQLKTLLMQHPAVYAPEHNDEIRFFDRWTNAEHFSQLCMSPAWGLNKTDADTAGAIHYLLLYGRGIRKTRLRQYPVRLDKSVNYLLFPGCAAAIRKLMPAAKLIVLLRDPTKRAISDYYFNCNRDRDYDATRGYPSAKTPKPEVAESVREARGVLEALTGEDPRVLSALRTLQEGLPISPRDYDILRMFAYRERGLYAEQLQRYRTLFPKKQLLVLRSEDLFADPISVAKKTLCFLGLDPNEAECLRKSNADKIGDRNPGNYKTHEKNEEREKAVKYLNNYYAKPNAELTRLLNT